MDVYVECMVARQATNSQKMLRYLWLALCVLTLLASLFSSILFLPISVISYFMMKLVSGRMAAMYEYTYLNGEITFTRMTTNRRKKLFTCNMERVDQICPYREFQAPGKGFAATKDFASGAMTDDLYVMVASTEKGKVRIYFEPSTEMLDAMWRVAPRIVKKAWR